MTTAQTTAAPSLFAPVEYTDLDGTVQSVSSVSELPSGSYAAIDSRDGSVRFVRIGSSMWKGNQIGHVIDACGNTVEQFSYHPTNFTGWVRVRESWNELRDMVRAANKTNN